MFFFEHIFLPPGPFEEMVKNLFKNLQAHHANMISRVGIN